MIANQDWTLSASQSEEILLQINCKLHEPKFHSHLMNLNEATSMAEIEAKS